MLDMMKLSGTPWEGNAMDNESNAPTGPVTPSRSKDQNSTLKGFIIMSQSVNRLTNG